MVQNSIFTFKRIYEQIWLTTSTQINFCCNIKDLNLLFEAMKFTTNPRTKEKQAVTDTQYIQQSVHTYVKLLNNQSTKASICPFFVPHQWLLHANLTSQAKG